MALDYEIMADAMETALGDEWLSAKGEDMPKAGSKDRELLFKGIARGMLHYLESEQNNILKSITLQQASTAEVKFDVKALDLNTLAGT